MKVRLRVCSIPVRVMCFYYYNMRGFSDKPLPGEIQMTTALAVALILCPARDKLSDLLLISFDMLSSPHLSSAFQESNVILVFLLIAFVLFLFSLE